MKVLVLSLLLVVFGIGVALACEEPPCVCEQTVNNYETTHVTQVLADDQPNHVIGGLYLNLEHDFSTWLNGGIHTEYLTPGQRGVDAKGEAKILVGATIKI